MISVKSNRLFQLLLGVKVLIYIEFLNLVDFLVDGPFRGVEIAVQRLLARLLVVFLDEKAQVRVLLAVLLFLREHLLKIAQKLSELDGLQGPAVLEAQKVYFDQFPLFLTNVGIFGLTGKEHRVLVEDLPRVHLAQQVIFPHDLHLSRQDPEDGGEVLLLEIEGLVPLHVDDLGELGQGLDDVLFLELEEAEVFQNRNISQAESQPGLVDDVLVDRSRNREILEVFLDKEVILAVPLLHHVVLLDALERAVARGDREGLESFSKKK